MARARGGYPGARLAEGLLAGPSSPTRWFFRNLYEALVKVRHRVASAEPTPQLARTPFGPGSPGRYYVPLSPLNLPSPRPLFSRDGDSPAGAAGWSWPLPARA